VRKALPFDPEQLPTKKADCRVRHHLLSEEVVTEYEIPSADQAAAASALAPPAAPSSRQGRSPNPAEPA